MACEGVEEVVEAFSLMYSSIPSMLARSACELGLPDILHTAGQPLSALQIAERVQNYPSEPALHATATRLERVMRCLCAHGVFKIHVEDDVAASVSRECQVEYGTDGHVVAKLLQASNENGHVEGEVGVHVAARRGVRPTRYCLNAVSRLLLKCPGEEEEHSLRGMLMFLTSPALMKPWEHLTQHILHGGAEPFERAHGLPLWRYAHTNPHFSALLNNAMSSDTISMQALLTHYHGFTSVHSLVDVGGGVGTAASRILSFYPSLKVICFDLPHVIATAPYHPGVVFIAGDMFKSIPKGDAIFMKRILHDWNDEDCIKILKNCHKVLPQHGKVIIMDVVMQDPSGEENTFSKLRTSLDISMLAGTKGGKERTKDQWEIILQAANFVHYNFFELPCPRCIIEAFRTLDTTL